MALKPLPPLFLVRRIICGLYLPTRTRILTNCSGGLSFSHGRAMLTVTAVSPGSFASQINSRRPKSPSERRRAFFRGQVLPGQQSQDFGVISGSQSSIAAAGGIAQIQEQLISHL